MHPTHRMLRGRIEFSPMVQTPTLFSRSHVFQRFPSSDVSLKIMWTTAWVMGRSSWKKGLTGQRVNSETVTNKADMGHTRRHQEWQWQRALWRCWCPTASVEYALRRSVRQMTLYCRLFLVCRQMTLYCRHLISAASYMIFRGIRAILSQRDDNCDAYKNSTFF